MEMRHSFPFFILQKTINVTMPKRSSILIAQAREEGKPENIIEKMVMGRINKFYQEVCLLEGAGLSGVTYNDIATVVQEFTCGVTGTGALNVSVRQYGQEAAARSFTVTLTAMDTLIL